MGQIGGDRIEQGDEFPLCDEQVRNLAYCRWESRGRPLWDSDRDWFAAEAQLRAELSSRAHTEPTRALFVRIRQGTADRIRLGLRRVMAWLSGIAQRPIGSAQLR